MFILPIPNAARLKVARVTVAQGDGRLDLVVADPHGEGPGAVAARQWWERNQGNHGKVHGKWMGSKGRCV